MPYLLSDLVMLGCLGFIAASLLYTIIYFLFLRHQSCRWYLHLLRLSLITYLLCLGYITLSPAFPGETRPASVNLNPFSSIITAVRSGWETLATQQLLNILLFVPLGFLIPMLFPSFHKMWKLLLCSFSLSLCIESLQWLLPLGRAFDVDDLLLNTLGGLLGFSCYNLVSLLIFRSSRRPNRLTCLASIGIFLLLPAFFLGVFLYKQANPYTYAFSSYLAVLPKQIELSSALQDAAPVHGTIYAAQPFTRTQLQEKLENTFAFSGTRRQQAPYIILENTSGASLSFFNEDCILRDNAWWNYTLRRSTEQPCRNSNAALAEQAEQYLKEVSLWEQGMQLEAISPILTESDTGSTVQTGKCILFCVETSLEVRGFIELYFDSAGLFQIIGNLSYYTPTETCALSSPAQAVIRLKEDGLCYFYYGEEYFADHAYFDPQSILIDQAVLVYKPSLDGYYLLPVWHLRGTFSGMQSDQQCPGELFLPALS